MRRVRKDQGTRAKPQTSCRGQLGQPLMVVTRAQPLMNLATRTRAQPLMNLVTRTRTQCPKPLTVVSVCISSMSMLPSDDDGVSVSGAECARARAGELGGVEASVSGAGAS